MLQNATALRKSGPWPSNSSHEHVFCTAPATENASLQILFKCPMPAIVFGNATNPHVLLTFDKVHNPLRLPRKTTLQGPSGAYMWCFVDFDLEMCFAPRRRRRALFRHLNFQKAPNPSVFDTFDFEMCFAPQRRARFRHLSFQKCSEAEVFCALWLGNVLRATMACNFASLILPGSAPAALPSLLFWPSGAPNHWKNTVFRDFPTFSRTWIFFLRRLRVSLFDILSSSLLFSSLTFPISAFHLSILSEVWLLNFLRQLHCTTLRYTTLITI